MIKNRSLPALLSLVALTVAASGCERKKTYPAGFGPDESYQGIVEHEERVLAVEVAGRVASVGVKRGDAVESGATIAKLDDTVERLTREIRADEEAVARADLASLEAGAKYEDLGSMSAEVSAASATLAVSQKNVERARTLFQSGSVSRAELDRAEADLDRATAQRKSVEMRLRSMQTGARPQEIARARARVETTRSVLELEDALLARYELKTKTDGLVLDVHVKAGELATVGSPVATIADVTHPYADVFVPVGAVDKLHIGTKAEAWVDSLGNGGKTVPGEIEFISPKTEFTPRYLFSERERPHLVIRIRVRLDDKERALHAGVPTFVRFAP